MVGRCRRREEDSEHVRSSGIRGIKIGFVAGWEVTRFSRVS